MIRDLLEGDNIFSNVSQISLEVFLSTIYGRVDSDKEDVLTALT